VIVVDASATVEYLTEAGEVGEWARETIEREPEVAAPHIVDVEVLSAIRKKLFRKDVTRVQAEEAIIDFGDLALVRYPVTDFIDRIWELRSILTPYDGAYIALSEALEVGFVTTDSRLARSRGHRARIVAFPG